MPPKAFGAEQMNTPSDSRSLEGVILVCTGFEESREIDLSVCVEMARFTIFVTRRSDLCLFWPVISRDVP